MKTLVVGYVRVSTEEQAGKGISLEAQEEKIRQWAALHDADSLSIHRDEGVSGKSMKRAGLRTALDQASISGEHRTLFVVYSLSRLSRSTKDTIAIIERLSAADIEFVSIVEQFDTTTAMGRAFLKIIAVLNELEREQTVERTKEIMAHKRRNGEATGHAPYGFRVDGFGKLEPNPEEWVAVRMIWAAIDEFDDVSYSLLAGQLDMAGARPRSNGKWDRGVLRRIVLFYKGENGRALREAWDNKIAKNVAAADLGNAGDTCPRPGEHGS